MRIAVANWSRRKIGGAESYLDLVIPGLVQAGHEIGFLCEVDTPAERDRIAMPDATPVWCVAEQESRVVIDRLREWRPDLIFSHALSDAALERAIIDGRKGIFYAHNYYGGCVSGAKTRSFPRVRPCDRRFGAGCLLQFYPRRCGGLNPALIWKLYLREAGHREVLHRYSVIATASEHMRREYIQQGFDPKAVRMVSSPIAAESLLDVASAATAAQAKFGEDGVRLLFVGRMVTLKGGEQLLDALPVAAAALRSPITLTFAGDGPARAGWVRKAASLQSRCELIRVEFRGWLSGAALTKTVAATHLLVMPSLWPEPFGRSGLEAGRWGIPTVAFAVGGIPEWLIEGVNGHLAPGDPATASGLAEAIVRALADRDHYAQLCSGARARFAEYSITAHIDRLTALFTEVLTN
jgi:glycosyltransferase involved in cell wall biosynthesis